MTQARTRDAPTLAPGFTSAEGAAHYCGLSERTIWRLVKSGSLPSHRVGTRVLIKYSDLDSMITGRREGEDS